MALISDDDFFAPAQSPNNAGAQSATPRVIDDKSFLAADPLDPKVVRPSLMDVLTSDGNALEEAKRGLKKGIGMAGQVADMALGLPGQAIRVGANIGGRLNALTSGGTAADADWAGKALADQVPPSLTNPIGTLMRAVGFGESYDNNQVAHVMESVMGVVSRGGEWVEEKTGKVLTKRAVEDLFETTLLSLGARGTAAVADPKLARVQEPGKVMTVGPMKGMHIDEVRSAMKRYRAPVRPKEEPSLGDEPIPVGEVRYTPDSAADPFQPKGPGVWQMPRAKSPVGEATDLTNEPKLPVGEATEVPYIPTGEAIELPADGIPVGEARVIGGAVGAKIADKMAKGVVPAAVVGTGLGLALAYPEHKDEIAAGVLGGVLTGKGKNRGLEYLKNVPDTAPLGAVLEPSATTLLTLERLDPKRFEFPKSMIEQELRRSDVSKAEKELFEQVLKEISGDAISAKALVTHLKMRMGDWELERVESSRWADYGLEGIDRKDRFENAFGDVVDPQLFEGATAEQMAGQPDWWDILDRDGEFLTEGRGATAEEAIADARAANDRVAEPQASATTTIYRLPEDLGVNSGENHFSAPDYFAHTRSFVEGGVRHVVEIQSDLVQKMRELTPEEVRETSRQLEEAKEELRNAEMFNKAITQKRPDGGTDYARGYTAQDRILLQPYQLKVAELSGKLRNSELAARNRPLVEPMLKDWYKRIVREELARESQPQENPTWEPLKIQAERRRAEAEDFYERYGNAWAERLRELRVAQAAAEAAIPPKMLMPRQTVRFATADTVAKVEGWSRAATERDVAQMRDLVKSAEANVEEVKRTGTGFVYDPDVPKSRAVEMAEKELKQYREQLAGYEEELASGRQFARKEHQSIYDRYRGDVEKFLRRLGGKPYTDSAGHTWIEVPTGGSKEVRAGSRVQTFGRADPNLINAVALITGGAALTAWASSREERVKNAALAAAVIGLTLYAKGRSKAVSEWVDAAATQAENVLSVISTEIGNMAPALLKRMRDHERWVLTNTHERLNQIAPFIDELRKLPEGVRTKLNAALLTGDPQAVKDAIIASGSRSLQKSFETVRGLLNQMGRELHAVGRLRQLIISAESDYYPRIVVDVKGLLEALGGAEKTALEKTLFDAQHASARRAAAPLTDLETSLIINKFLRQRRGGGKSGFLQRRSVDEVTPELARFYAPASESLPIYVRAMTKEIEKAKFFGEELVRDSETGMTNLELSIGNIVNKERMKGKLSDEQITRLGDLLHSRFGPGERATSGTWQTVRNLTNVGLLGSFTSSIVQLGDAGLAAAAHGLVPAVKAAIQTLTRHEARATVRDIGLVDHITEEITGGARTPVIVFGRELSTAKFVEKTFKFNGFSLVDQFGKSVSINASWMKNQKLAQTAAGVKRLQAKYGEAWGSDFPSLVEDLRKGEMTENVKSLLFYELSDLQPISKLEVPKAYLDNPNGRLLYQMRTYMVKQMDVLRREAYQEIKRGNTLQGAKNLLRYGTALGVSGASTSFIVNWILGKDDKLEWGDIPENALKTIGVSSYLRDKMRAGEPLAFIQSFAPPFKMWNEIISGDPKAVQYMPPLGKIFYYREMGGAERSDAYAKKQERLNEMSDADYDRMLRRREERKARAH